MRRAALAKTVAFGVAVLAHAALALTLHAPEPLEMEGSHGAAEVRLGSAFKDMAMGTLQAEVVHEADRIKAEPVREALSAAQPSPLQTKRSEPLAAETPAHAALAPVPVAPAAAPEALALTPAAQPQRLEAVEDSLSPAPTVTTSLRPKMRSPDFVEAHKAPPPPPKTKTMREPAKPQAQPITKPKTAQTPKGNATQNARAGASTGQATGKATSSGSGGTAKSAGNASASKYPGLVMRKISRVGRPRVNSRGAAVVAFSISGGGGLASVRLARSSGNAALDQAALGIVRKAAPFPAPPAGAQRSFSITIKGR